MTDGSHTISAVALDAAGNSATSSNVSVTVTQHRAGGRVRLRGDFRSNGHRRFNAFDGTICGATRVTDGRFGRALSFDGVNDSVAIANSPALNPNAGHDDRSVGEPVRAHRWRPVVMKEQATSLPYALYANSDTTRRRHPSSRPPRSRPPGRRRSTSDLDAPGDELGRQRRPAVCRRRPGGDPRRPRLAAHAAPASCGSAATASAASSSPARSTKSACTTARLRPASSPRT